jgi:formylglycine-generating enzyme required for sulfatase activity
MLGNMAEWCADWYGPYPSDAIVDPVGPSSGTERVVRGRSHEDTGHNPRNPMDIRYGFHAADRQAMVPGADWKQYTFRTVGFRVVVAAEPKSKATVAN